jgi:outer membrane receptor protein involved in Fe transport
LEIYTGELQQILQHREHTVVLGGRAQAGDFDTRSALGPSAPTQFANQTLTNPIPLASAATTDGGSTDFTRFNAYGYYSWQVIEPLLLTAGLNYDWLEYPLNFRHAPVASTQTSEDQWSPKAGLIWTPHRTTTVRGAYTRSLGGVSFDQSFRLEPTQVAGFNQAFRSVIPESAAGSVSAPEFETWSAALDQKFPGGTYFGVQAERLGSEAVRDLGAIHIVPFPYSSAATTTRQTLDYAERNITVTLNQLVGNEWSLGARYRLSRAELETRLPEIPPSVSVAGNRDLTAILHQVNLFALFAHPSAFFGRFDSIWSQQSNRGYTPDIPGDDFWQFNVMAGYRFARRRAEVRLALLNLTDRDYRLNPLNLTTELPSERTLMASLRFNF